jgi:hypothetical protein
MKTIKLNLTLGLLLSLGSISIAQGMEQVNQLIARVKSTVKPQQTNYKKFIDKKAFITLLVDALDGEMDPKNIADLLKTKEVAKATGIDKDFLEEALQIATQRASRKNAFQRYIDTLSPETLYRYKGILEGAGAMTTLYGITQACLYASDVNASGFFIASALTGLTGYGLVKLDQLLKPRQLLQDLVLKAIASLVTKPAAEENNLEIDSIEQLDELAEQSPLARKFNTFWNALTPEQQANAPKRARLIGLVDPMSLLTPNFIDCLNKEQSNQLEALIQN